MVGFPSCHRDLAVHQQGEEPVAELGELLVFSGVVGDLLESRLNDCSELFNDFSFGNSKFGQLNVIRDDGIED